MEGGATGDVRWVAWSVSQHLLGAQAGGEGQRIIWRVADGDGKHTQKIPWQAF